MNQSSIRGSWNSLRMSRNGWLPLALAALWVAGGNDRPIAQVGGGYTLVTLPSMETAWDVNDAGQAVGLWTNPAYPGSRGYVWTPTDGMLPDAGATQRTPTGFHCPVTTAIEASVSMRAARSQAQPAGLTAPSSARQR